MNSEQNCSANDEVLVRVEGASKKFCRSLKQSLLYGLCDIVGELSPFGRPDIVRHKGYKIQDKDLDSLSQRPFSSPLLRDGEFWAVNDISFELRRGECLGLIGHNGAGKTTLLKMLNGLIKPDRGRIEMNGRVGALISLGAGFNPILTGRENIYINGAVLGLSRKEIEHKIDEIINFSELREFIEMPVQNYSSGMQVRLGFSIASSLCPDVLILDEVLAVGDIGFVIKCLNRIRAIAANAAVILVTHQMQFVSAFCTRVILMQKGSTLLDTRQPGKAIDRYYDMVPAETNVTGTGEARVSSIHLDRGDVVLQGQSAELTIDFEIDKSSASAFMQIFLMDESMSPVICMPVVSPSGELRRFEFGVHALNVLLGTIELSSGKYSFTIAIADNHTQRTLVRSQGLHPFRVYADQSQWGRIVRPVVAISK